MNFKQYYLGCLSHASYYIGSEDEAAVVDPQRDVEQYLSEAASYGQKIRYIIETHSHADFVSGHAELAAKTGAEIIYGRRAKTQFPTRHVKDGDELRVGGVRLRFFETPGHTPEGISILAVDDENPSDPAKLFTGDTLFIGDVGRPDLVGSKGFTADEMAGMLYDSLHEKILPLADDTEVYPAHGAGSLCGKSLSKETWSTLGQQRKLNYALQPMSRSEFIKIVAADQPEAPMYFPKSAAKNLSGSSLLAEIPPPRELSSEEIASFNGVVVDVRQAADYGRGHVPNSINIGLGGQFASWAGTLIPIGTPIAVAADNPTQVEEAVTRLARVGHETASGFILMHNYTGETQPVEQISVSDAFDALQNKNDAHFIDVRRSDEYATGHAPDFANLPLDKLSGRLDNLDKNVPTYVICQGGYRSSIGTGILEKAGFTDLHNVEGGTAAWTAAGLPTDGGD